MEFAFSNSQEFVTMIRYFYSTECKRIMTSSILDAFVDLATGQSWVIVKDEDGIGVAYLTEDSIVIRGEN